MVVAAAWGGDGGDVSKETQIFVFVFYCRTLLPSRIRIPAVRYGLLMKKTRKRHSSGVNVLKTTYNVRLAIYALNKTINGRRVLNSIFRTTTEYAFIRIVIEFFKEHSKATAGIG